MKTIVKTGLSALVLVPFVALTVQASEYDGVTVVPTGALEAASEKQDEADKVRQKMLIQLYKERKGTRERVVMNPVEKTEAHTAVRLENVDTNVSPTRNWRPSARYYINTSSSDESVTDSVESTAKKMKPSAPKVTGSVVSPVGTTAVVSSGVPQIKLQQVENILNQAKAGKITEAQFKNSLKAIAQ